MSWVLGVERLGAESSHPRALGPTHKAGLWSQRSKRSSTMEDVVSISGWVVCVWSENSTLLPMDMTVLL